MTKKELLAAGAAARHAGGGDRPRGDPPQLRELSPAPAESAGVLRGEGQSRRRKSCARFTRRAPVSTWLRCPSSCWCMRTSSTCRPRSGRISSGTRSSTPIPIKPQGDAPGAGPIQAAGHLRQPRRTAQDQALRSARRPGAAPARAQHRVDGGVVLEVRLRPGRSGGSDPGSVPHRPGGGGPELPRRQPVHQLRELRAGAEYGGGGDGRRRDRAATRSRFSTSAAAFPSPTTRT